MWIYKITNLVNNKVYIGQTRRSVEDRWRDHCTLTKSKHKSLIRLAIAKYGQDSFKIEIIDECSSVDELNTREQVRIKELNTLSPNGYNLDFGGKSKIIHQESRRKMSLAKLGKSNPHTKQSKKKLSLAKTGVRFTENHKLALSKARKDKKRIKCLNNGVIYNSTCEAAKALKLTTQNISQCLHGKRKSTHGFQFEVVSAK